MKYLCIYKEANGEIVHQIEDMTKKQYEQKLDSEAFDADSNFVCALKVTEVVNSIKKASK